MSVEKYFRKIGSWNVTTNDIKTLARYKSVEFLRELFGREYVNQYFAMSVGWRCGYYNGDVYSIDDYELDVGDFTFDDVQDYGVLMKNVIYVNLTQDAQKVVDKINRIRHAKEITLDVLEETTIRGGYIYDRTTVVAGFETILRYKPTFEGALGYFIGIEGNLTYISMKEIQSDPIFTKAWSRYVGESDNLEDSE